MKIIFYTTSTLSDVQEVNSMCISHYFNEYKHTVIDGRYGWFTIWYKWLDMAYDDMAEWYIYVDEDCFILDRQPILDTIDYMEKNGYDIAGSPDGCCEYRSCNYMALNSYFMIVNRRCVEAWHNRPSTIPQFKKEWIRPYPFEKRNDYTFIYDMEFGTSGKPLGQIWRAGSEPYYDFFWVLMDKGMRFLYIEPLYGEKYQTSDLLDHTIMHLWHQRERYADYNVSPTMHKGSNKDRYDNALRYVKNEINK